jgi:hypothetical protein
LCDEQEAMSASHHGVASQPPCETADRGLVLRFTLQLVQALSHQIPYRVGRLELERQRAFGREDPQEHLHAMLEPLHAGERSPMPHSMGSTGRVKTTAQTLLARERAPRD